MSERIVQVIEAKNKVLKVDDTFFKDKKIVIITHSADYDGHCSLEIIRKYFTEYDWDKDNKKTYTIKYIPINYGDPELPEADVKDKVVVCCDFTPPNIRKLVKQSNLFIHIDHHKSAIESLYDFNPENMIKVYEYDYSACEGVWNYFYPDKKVPQSVRLISSYDIFKVKEFKQEEFFAYQFGLKYFGKDTAVGGKLWEKLLKDDKELDKEIFEKGGVILRYHNDYFYNELMSRAAMTVTLKTPDDKEYTVLALNAPCVFSQTFQAAYDPEKHDMFICYYKNGYGEWSNSFYAPPRKDIDVSKIAKLYGGGGHKGASGCVTKKCLI